MLPVHCRRLRRNSMQKRARRSSSSVAATFPDVIDSLRCRRSTGDSIMFAPFDLSKKTVLVTGANAGIGLGMADALAAAGATLIIWGRRQDRNEAAAEALR